MVRRASPRHHWPQGLRAVSGCVFVSGRSDELGPGAPGTRACLFHGHSMDHAWSVTGHWRHRLSRARGAGGRDKPAPWCRARSEARPPAPPVQATRCCPLPAHWPPPPGPPACGRRAVQTQLLLPPPPGEASGPSGWAHGALGWWTAGSHTPFFLDSASFTPNVLHMLGAVRRVMTAYYRCVGIFYLPRDKMKDKELGNISGDPEDISDLGPREGL